jgi:tetratricopeptide (TPR) repeat protein
LSAARKAVELDPDDAAAHAMLATALEPLLCWEEAELEFATALKLNPNSADTWALLSEFLVLQGHPSEAISAIEKALRLDPHPPGWYHWFLGQAQYLDRQFEKAVKTLRNDSTYRSQSRRTLAASLAQLGRLDEARQEADLFIASHPNFTIGHWTRSVPFESKTACELFVDGYRKAGLPE